MLPAVIGRRTTPPSFTFAMSASDIAASLAPKSVRPSMNDLMPCAAAAPTDS